jgi:hypothetical protein
MYVIFMCVIFIYTTNIEFLVSGKWKKFTNNYNIAYDTLHEI